MNNVIQTSALLLVCMAAAIWGHQASGDDTSATGVATNATGVDDEQAALEAGSDRVSAAMQSISQRRAEAGKLGKGVDFTEIQSQLDELVALESEYRGTIAGRSAIFGLANLARGYTGTELPIHQALRSALAGFESYGDHRDAMLLTAMLSDFSDPAALAAFDRIIEAPATLPEVREAAQLARAEWAFKKGAERADLQSRLAQGDDAAKEQVRLQLHTLPDDSQIEALRASAINDLKALAASDRGSRRIIPRPVDKASEFIVTEDAEQTMGNPLVSKLAAGTLFRELHLKRGAPAPELAVQLLDGSRWSLHEQKAPIVFVQFCHEGCGPCEAMYPVLRKVLEKYPDSIAVLTIMTDPTEEPALKGVERKKMTWNVAWNGANEDVAAQWGVRSYPECFTFYGDGKRLLIDAMAAEFLEQVVDALVNQPELIVFPEEWGGCRIQ